VYSHGCVHCYESCWGGQHSDFCCCFLHVRVMIVVFFFFLFFFFWFVVVFFVVCVLSFAPEIRFCFVFTLR